MDQGHCVLAVVFERHRGLVGNAYLHDLDLGNYCSVKQEDSCFVGIDSVDNPLGIDWQQDAVTYWLVACQRHSNCFSSEVLVSACRPSRRAAAFDVNYLPHWVSLNQIEAVPSPVSREVLPRPRLQELFSWKLA